MTAAAAVIILSDPKTCPSTHGGDGYPPQTVVAPDGELHCPFCGVVMDRTFYDRGQATYVDINTYGEDVHHPPRKLGLLARLFGRRP